MSSMVLFITGIIFLMLGVFSSIKQSNNLISKLSTGIFIFAGGTYLLMGCLSGFGNTTPIRVLRYIDWFITVPIMVIQLSYFFNNSFNFKKIIPSILLALLMLGAGLAGELGFNPEWGMVEYDGGYQFMDMRQHEYKQIWGIIGVGFMFNFFVSMAKYITRKNLDIFIKVFILWGFYPIVYFLPESGAILIGYSIIDLTAKAGIGFFIEHKFNKNVTVNNGNKKHK